MPLIFCDLNFIVTAHQGPDAYKGHLKQLAATGTVTFVLSPMHWVDAAEDNDAVRRTAKADFMDSLDARWLYDRRGIQRREVALSFFQFLLVPCDTPQMIAPLRDVIADLAGRPAERNSRDFVAHLSSVGESHPLKRSLNDNFETNRVNGGQFRAGQFTSAFLQRIERIYIQQLLPAQTPAGVVIDENSKERFVNSYQLTDFPAFALETRATHDSWQQQRQMNRNNFIDQQHLMALPYVEYFVTDDVGLRGLIARISAGLPFPIASLLTKAEFDVRYPSRMAGPGAIEPPAPDTITFMACPKKARFCIFPKWKRDSESCSQIGDCEFGSEQWKQWEKGASVQIYVCPDHQSACHRFARRKQWTW